MIVFFITSTSHLAQTKLNCTTKCIKVFYPPVVEFFTPVEVRLFFGGVFVCQLSSGLWVKVPVSSSSSSRELRMLGCVQRRETGTRSACRPQRETLEPSCSAFKIKAHRCCFQCSSVESLMFFHRELLTLREFVHWQHWHLILSCFFCCSN